MDTSDHLYRSPKRKRCSDSTQCSPIVSPTLTRIVTNLQEFPFVRSGAVSDPVDRKDDGSPRTCVAVQLRGLDLQQDSMVDDRHSSKRLAAMKAENEGPLTGYHHLRGHLQSIDFGSFPPPQAQESARPLVSSIFPSPDAAFTFEAGELPPANAGQAQMHRRSPPLDGDPEDNPMTWHESEITGHDPNDPNDDGYGVNGIGYKPTPAQAWARSQRRKQQLAEYKSREAKEARQRRSERRRMESGEVSSDEDPGKAKRKAVRVHFEDG